MMKRLIDCLHNRDYFIRGFSVVSVNVSLFSYYRKDINAYERLMFEKMIVLQRVFGAGKYFDYDRKRFMEELGMGKDAVRTAIEKLKLKGILKVKKFAKKGEKSYSYLVDFEFIANNAELIYDKNKLDMNNDDDRHCFENSIPQYFRHLNSGSMESYTPNYTGGSGSLKKSIFNSREEEKEYLRIMETSRRKPAT